MNNTNSLCGLIMPISAIDGCNEQHWLDVKQILTEAIELSGYSANLVSYADDVGIIQKRIIQNLYENPIVVCDVSGKNPNVMFELGMRLAFDKPTIIVKDDKTSYSFDTSPIEHLEYPRDLRFKKIVDFKDELAKKIKATVEKSNTDPGYTTFLKHFGTFTIAKLDSKEVSKEDYIIEEIKELKKYINAQFFNRNNPVGYYGKYPQSVLKDIVESLISSEIERLDISGDKINDNFFLKLKNKLINSDKIRQYFASEDEFNHIFDKVVTRLYENQVDLFN
ncbi:RNA helicase [Vibrio cholerae]|nr:RNA helicase [Vibrio cholerae]EJL6307561.1 RNA helicase [Vibrio cholerae]ELH0844943.1 RNA helicase [Vibrio cholerae]